MNIPLYVFDFDKFEYEVAFEYRDSSFLRRLLTGKRDFIVFYIRRIGKMDVKAEQEQLLSYIREDEKTIYEFLRRDYGYWKAHYWNNPTEPQDILMRASMKLRPSQENVFFSTASLR